MTAPACPPGCTCNACAAAAPFVPAAPVAPVAPFTRRRLLQAVPLLATAAGAAAATPGEDAPPLPQPARPLVVPALSRSVLDNGLTVVCAPRPGAPLVSLTLLVRAGAEADPPGLAGTAALTANLLAKGARRGGRAVGAPELARQAEALGGALESNAGWDATSVSMTVTTPRAEAALALMADVLRQPLLAADELARARTQTLDGLKLALGDPGQVAGQVLRRAYWGATAYGQVVTPASVQRITRADVQRCHATWVRPSRTALIVAGDLTPAQAQALAQRLLGDWRVATPEPPPPAPAQPQPLAAPLVLVDMPGTGQSSVALAAPYAASDEADSAQRRVAQLANAVLGGGYSSRLNQEVRIKRGLSYGAGTSAETHPGAGMASATAQTNHPTAAQVLQILRDEVTQLGERPPSADELAARQATLVGAFARRLETNAGLASLVVAQLIQGRPLDELNRYAAEVMAVTPAQVSAFARGHWTGPRLRAVIAGDLGAAGDSLQAVSGGALRVPLAALDLSLPGLRKPA
jgi:zinc protease